MNRDDMQHYSSLTVTDRDRIKAARLLELEQQIYLMTLQELELCALHAAFPADREIDGAIESTRSQLAALHIRLHAVDAVTNTPSTSNSAVTDDPPNGEAE